MSFSHVLEGLQARVDAGRAWYPERFDPASPDEVGTLTQLIASGGVAALHDALDSQLHELVELREPDRDLSADESRTRIDALLEGRAAHAYGTWFYYPWSKRLVHVLPEAEFIEVRQSRNRNKITLAEQERLAGLRIGVMGLSVGRATAITLAMEGIGGEFRLADFDALSLSNLNRLRAGVHAIGINKAVLAAREIFELNPYANVQIFPEGITEDNLHLFLAQRAPLDLLFEECDDLYIKVRIRECARALGIPVIMETSDRGLIDIERFDLQPARPILHGLVGDINAHDLKGLDTYDKVPVVMRILGQEALSPRLAASMMEIKTTLKSWPQLASAVALGGALNADVGRRVALNQLTSSGRYYVDFEDLVRPQTAQPLAAPPADVAPLPEAMRPGEAPDLQPGRDLDRETLRAFVQYGAMAPSGGNCQPWRFIYGDERLRCLHDEQRSRNFLDFEHRASFVALGAAVENISLAAEQAGLGVQCEPFPDPDSTLEVCSLAFVPRRETPRDTHLFAQIPLRVTNRKLGYRVPLLPETTHAMREAAMAHDAEIQFVEDPRQLERMGEILGRGDRVRFLHELMHQEMMAEVRWNSEEVRRTRDGLDIATLELTATDLAGLRLTRSWRAMRLVGRFGGGRGLQKPSRKAVAAAAGVGLLTVTGNAPEDYLRGGRALQRAWLAAGAQGYAFQPMTALVYLFSRLDAGGTGMDDDLRAEVASLRAAFDELFDVPAGHASIMLFRLAKADPPSARALRRPVEEILTFDEDHHGRHDAAPPAAAESAR